MTEDNPIIAEIRAVRETMLAEHNGDLNSLVKHLKRRQEEAARAGRKVISPPTPRSEPQPARTRKAG
jgi:hypothetical protein